MTAPIWQDYHAFWNTEFDWASVARYPVLRYRIMQRTGWGDVFDGGAWRPFVSVDEMRAALAACLRPVAVRVVPDPQVWTAVLGKSHCLLPSLLAFER